MAWLAAQFQTNGWIDHWQTLITGGLAIAAAFIGGLFINRQIAAARQADAEARRRKLDAARATLPLTLSALSEYATGCNKALKMLHGTQDSGSIPKQADPAPTVVVPVDVIVELRLLIEFGDAPVGTAIRKLLSELQVQIARIATMTKQLKQGYDDDHSITVLNVETYMIDTADIYARCAALFDFARGKTDTLPGAPLRADIKSALRQTGVWEDNFSRVHQLAESRYAL